MELRDLLCVDTEYLSAAQAQQVVGDVIATLASGVMASDQPRLRSLLIAASGSLPVSCIQVGIGA